MRLRALLATILMLAVVMSPAVFAEDSDAYHLVITYPDQEYGVDDEVDVTVHVFEKASYASVDSVTFMVVDSEFDMREIEMTETGTGQWTGTFTIVEGDITDLGFYKYVSMAATAEVESLTVEETAGTITIPTTEEATETLGITSSMDPPGVYMGPGESKTITWEIRYNNQLVTPATLEGNVYEGSGSDAFSPTQQSTGVYTYEYTMPNGPRSMEVDLNLDATYEAGSDTVEGESDVDLFLNFLHVWAKKAAVSATTASFDLFVSNMTGAPVEAAAINLDFYYEDDDFNDQMGSANGTTDVEGRATVDLAYNDLGDAATTVDIDGKVVGQGKEQALEFELRVRAEPDDPPDPDEFGLDVIPDKEMFDFDKDVNLPATAYYDGEPHSSGTMYWYAYTSHAVLNKGEETTNVAGDFSVDFRTPQKGTMDPSFLTTHFETPIEDVSTYYYDDSEFMSVSSFADIEEPDSPYDALRQFKDGAVKVSVNKLEKNKDIPVTVTYNDADEEWMVAVMVGIDPNPGNMGLVPTWTYWTTSMWTGAYGDLCSYDGSKFTANIFLPENLPNKDFYVSGLAVNQEGLMANLIGGNFADYIKTNYVDGLEIGQAGSSGGDGGDGFVDRLMDDWIFGIPLLYWIFMLLMVVILGVVMGLLMTRKKPVKEIAEPGLEPTAEGPSFDGGPGAAAMPMPPTAYDQMQPVAGEADYGAPPPVAPAQPEYMAPETAPAAYETPPPPAAAPTPEYGAPLPPAAPAQPDYAAPAVPPEPAQPDYAAPVAPPATEYAAPAPPVAPAPAEPVAPPVAPPPAGIPPAAVPPIADAPPPAAAPPVAPPPAAPVAPDVPPPAPASPPAPAPAPAPAAPPTAVAPAAAAPAADPGATMTIRCQKCQTTLTIPRKRPIKVTCPNCGVSGVLR
jgi:hypothetical protein